MLNEEMLLALCSKPNSYFFEFRVLQEKKKKHAFEPKAKQNEKEKIKRIATEAERSRVEIIKLAVNRSIEHNPNAHSDNKTCNKM